jgi:hypothetical protein
MKLPAPSARRYGVAAPLRRTLLSGASLYATPPMISPESGNSAVGSGKTASNLDSTRNDCSRAGIGSLNYLPPSGRPTPPSLDAAEYAWNSARCQPAQPVGIYQSLYGRLSAFEGGFDRHHRRTPWGLTVYASGGSRSPFRGPRQRRRWFRPGGLARARSHTPWLSSTGRQ